MNASCFSLFLHHLHGLEFMFDKSMVHRGELECSGNICKLQFGSDVWCFLKYVSTLFSLTFILCCIKLKSALRQMLMVIVFTNRP